MDLLKIELLSNLDIQVTALNKSLSLMEIVALLQCALHQVTKTVSTRDAEIAFNRDLFKENKDEKS